MPELTVPLETIYKLRDKEKELMRMTYLPQAVRERSREYYECFEELICWRIEHLHEAPKSQRIPVEGMVQG